MKRDPESYVTELKLLYRRFKYSMEPIVQQTDIGGFSSSFSVELGDKAFFFAQLSTSYLQHLSDFPDLLFFLLDRLRLNNIPPSLTSLRLRLTQSLILLLNKNVVGIDKEFQISKTSTSTKTTTSLFELLTKLQTLEDRPLKKLAKSHVIISIKKHQNNHARNKTLQTIIVNMLQSGEEKLANRSLVVFCNLQRINVWCKDLISNAICRVCHHPFPTSRKAALSFLLSHDETMIHNNDTNQDNDNYTDASSNEEDETSAAHHLGTTASKKKKRAKLKRHIRNMRRQQRHLKTTPNQYSPLSHLHDPDGFVDELYSYLHNDKRRVQLSEVNMMIIRVIARTIGLHRLIKPKVYSFIEKYLMPHEKEINKLLAAAVEVFHLNVVNNFVHNHSQPEEIAVGLNVVREISQPMPQLMNDDLLEDLVSYDKHPAKAISIAAHSLLKFFKEVNPSLLSRKFCPRFATNARPKQYEEVSVATGVPGADLLQQHIKNEAEENDSTQVEKDDDAEDDAMAFNGLDNSVVNECCAEDRTMAGEVREDDVEMEEESSNLIESDDSHVEISGERKRKYADFDQQLDTVELDFRSLKKLAVPKTELLSGTNDHFYSNEEFKQIKKLLGSQHELRRCSGSKSVNPTKLEASIRTKMTKENRVKSAKAGREDKNEYKSRTAVKQNKRGGSSNRQKDHKKFMPIAAKRGKITRSKQEKKRKKMSGKRFRGRHGNDL